MKNEILELMLQAERRDIPWADTLAMPRDPHNSIDPFDNCDSIVELVTLSIRYDLEVRGEIDAVDQGHYLQGRNYDPMMDPDFWKEN